MPLSRMHTRTPAPSAPPNAHSRVTRSGHSVGREIPSTAPAGRLHAGSASSIGRILRPALAAFSAATQTWRVGATRLVPTLPRQAWIVLGGDALSAIGSGLTLPFFVVYLHRVRGIELDVAGLALATIAFASLAGNPTGGFLADRLGPRRAVVAGLVVAAAGTASIAFVSHPWQAFAAAALTGFGLAVVWPALDSLLAVTVRPGQRSSVFAVRHATLNAGFGIGALVAATIVEFDSTRTFQLLYLLD